MACCAHRGRAEGQPSGCAAWLAHGRACGRVGGRVVRWSGGWAASPRPARWPTGVRSSGRAAGRAGAQAGRVDSVPSGSIDHYCGSRAGVTVGRPGGRHGPHLSPAGDRISPAGVKVIAAGLSHDPGARRRVPGPGRLMCSIMMDWLGVTTLDTRESGSSPILAVGRWCRAG